MTRSIIRHYIGNRDDLVEALVQRNLDQAAAELKAQYQGLSPQDSVALSLETMFTERPSIAEQDRVVLEVMMTAEGRYPVAKKRLKQAFSDLVASFAADLNRAHPGANRAHCEQVAYAVICMSEMNEAFMWLGLPPRHNTSARAVAEELIAALG